MAYVSAIISGAACLGVLLGLISGIFFLVLAAVKWMSRVRSSLSEEELARQKKFLVSSSCLLDSSLSPETKETENGLAPNGSAHLELDRRSQSSSEKPMHWDKCLPDQSKPRKEESGSDTVRVRELMEKMVETMIGGPLDGTTVGQLSTHSAYQDEDPADTKDSNLKRLIKQIVDEAMDLPSIKDIGRPSKTPRNAAADDVDSKSYEDILATAILNKVIENFQADSHNDSEPSVGKPKPRVRQRKPRRNDAHDGDWSDTSRSDTLSLTIEEYIEEVTTALEASEDERSDFSDCETSGVRRIPFPESGRTVVEGTDDENSDAGDQSTATELLTSNSSWEENWLFQKKRLRSTPNAHHPVPVPMLVPNPSEDFRALVGGVDADELSDMSECSDFALEESVTPEAKPADEVDENSNEKVKVILTHITEESFLQRLEGSRCERSETAETEDECRGAQTKEGTGAAEPEGQKSVEEDLPVEGTSEAPPSTDGEDSPMRCRVAEREKEKWMHPVHLPDNPYSLENIQKRDHQRKINPYFRIGTYTGDSIDFPDYPTSSEDHLNRTPSNHLFTRDYYVNASKHPSGRSSPPRDFHQRLPDVPTEMPNDSTRLPDKTEFSLPSVRELAKHFLPQEPKHPTDGLQTKPESKHKCGYVPGDSPSQEPEVDYSTVPVSKLIVNLQQAAEPPSRENRKHVVYDRAPPSTQMEICRKVESNLLVENHTESGGRVEYKGKQVHSLTARSISKEFREGLRKNCYPKVLGKGERNSSGESDQGDVVYNRTKLSPTPSVDLKNMKKFWEEIITANSNSGKQK